MTIDFSTPILDQHIVPDVSIVTSAEIPDMPAYTKESTYRVANFYLNSVLNSSFAGDMNAYNQMKHMESRIENDQMLVNATVPVWLENEGLRSVDTTRTYGETVGIPAELAKSANIFMNLKTAEAALRESKANPSLIK